MARVVYRTRRPTSSRQPSSLIIATRTNAPLLQPSTEQQQTAIWVRAQHDQLTAVRDREELQKLADGHTEGFLEYAKQRVTIAVDPSERAYWQSLITRATAKLEDDTIAAGVNEGSITLEDLLSHFEDRLDALPGVLNNPNAPDLLNQIAQVKNSIAARDFRTEMLNAQQEYINNNDKTQAKIDYATKLNELLYRAKDPTAQQTIVTQLTQVRTAIENDKTLQRERVLSEKVALYADHKIPASELQTFLAQQAETATTPAEAQRYASLAIQVETNERTRTNQAITAASRAGAAALRDALFGPEQDYLNAKANLMAALDRGVPAIEAVNIFKTSAAAYDEAIRTAAPHTEGTQLTTLLNDRRTIETTFSELTKQTANKVVAEAQKRGAAFQTMIDVNKAGNNDAEQESQARFLWAQTLRDAANSPLMEGHTDQQDTIHKDLEVVTRAQAKEIADSSAILAGTKPTKAMTTQLPGLYKTYADQVASSGGTPLSQQDWAQGLGLGNLDRASAQATKQSLQQELAAGVDPTKADDIQKQIAILDAILGGDRNGLYRSVGAYVGNAVDGRSLLDFRRVRDAHNAEIDAETQRLVALTAGRGRDGSTAASPTNLYAQGGLLDESTRAMQFGRNAVTPNASATPTVVGGGTSAVEDPNSPEYAAAQQRAGSGGRAGMASPAEPQAPPQGSYDPNDGLPNDPRIRELQTHFDAGASLDQASSITLPTWEIPALPPEPAFDSPHLTIGDSQYLPPPFDFGAGGGIDWSQIPLPPFGGTPYNTGSSTQGQIGDSGAATGVGDATAPALTA